jgi:hypothetical protein
MHLGFNYCLFIGISNIAWKKVLWMLWEIYLEKGLLGLDSTLVYFIVGYGVLEVIDSHVDLEEFKSFGPFGGLGYVNALAITTCTCFQDIPSTLLVHPLFHSFLGGVEMFVYMMTKKLLKYCLTFPHSFIVQLSYIAHLPQIHPLFNFASSSIVHLPQIHPLSNFLTLFIFHKFIHCPTSTYSSIFPELKMVFEEVDVEKFIRFEFLLIKCTTCLSMKWIQFQIFKHNIMSFLKFSGY